MGLTFNQLQLLAKKGYFKEDEIASISSVQYFTESEREEYRLEINNQVFSTKHDGILHTEDKAKKTHIYVQNKMGQFFVCEHESGLKNHSSFFAGAPVRSAGSFIFEKGKLIGVSNDSGHYRCSLTNFRDCLRSLCNKGINLGDVSATFYNSKTRRIISGIKAVDLLNKNNLLFEPLKSTFETKFSQELENLDQSELSNYVLHIKNQRFFVGSQKEPLKGIEWKFVLTPNNTLYVGINYTHLLDIVGFSSPFVGAGTLVFNESNGQIEEIVNDHSIPSCPEIVMFSLINLFKSQGINMDHVKLFLTREDAKIEKAVEVSEFERCWENKIFLREQPSYHGILHIQEMQRRMAEVENESWMLWSFIQAEFEFIVSRKSKEGILEHSRLPDNATKEDLIAWFGEKYIRSSGQVTDA